MCTARQTPINCELSVSYFVFRIAEQRLVNCEMADGPRYNLVDPSLEITDPNPNIHQLFVQFNDMFFWGKLATVYVKWSPRMTLCAGLCRYHPRNRECSIHLSQALLGFRPRKDLVETLLVSSNRRYFFKIRYVVTEQLFVAFLPFKF